MNACLVLCDVIAEHCLAVMTPHCGDEKWAVERTSGPSPVHPVKVVWWASNAQQCLLVTAMSSVVYSMQSLQA